MATIIYLHGFASQGDSAKSRALRSAFEPENQIFSPDLPINPSETKKIIDQIVRSAKSYPIIFVGTSLGGFWANYFSHKYDAPCVIVNPSTQPSKSMYGRVGQKIKNYANNNDITVTDKDVEEFSSFEQQAADLHNGQLVNLFLAKDDNVIPYKDTLDNLKYTNSLTITDDGGHRYDQNWNLVIDKINDIIMKSSK